MENIYYVYCHINPKTNKIFYVGVGKGDRVLDGGSKRNKSWKKMVYESGGYLFEFLKTCISKQDALKIEREYIKKIGLENLTNIVGEDGNSTAFKKGQTPWNKGLKGAQSFYHKSVIVKDIRYETINEAIDKLGIGKTTFYRWVKRGLVKYV
jgi:hypothetical protein